MQGWESKAHVIFHWRFVKQLRRPAQTSASGNVGIISIWAALNNFQVTVQISFLNLHVLELIKYYISKILLLNISRNLMTMTNSHLEMVCTATQFAEEQRWARPWVRLGVGCAGTWMDDLITLPPSPSSSMSTTSHVCRLHNITGPVFLSS